MLVRLEIAVFVCVAVATGACSRPGTPAVPDTSDPVVPADRDDVAAVVDGSPILVNEVRSLLAATPPEEGLDPQQALDALIRSELLAHEARRRGLHKHQAVADERKVALARVLLERQIGQGVTAETVDRARLRQFYDLTKARFVHGPQRVVHHLLVTGDSPSPTSQAIAIEARAALGSRATPERLREVAEGLEKTYPGRVRREELPPCTADDTIFVRPFIDAVFALSGKGEVSQPFKTEFGWHVALVVDERAASNQSFEEIEQSLAAEVVSEEKKRQFELLLKRLEEDSGVFLFDAVIAEWLAQ